MKSSVRDSSEAVAAQRTPLVSFNDVGLRFQRHRSIWDLIWPSRHPNAPTFWAVRGVSFDVFEGETVGVIGRNGSGKSSLSMLCAQVYQPDEGVARVNGRVQLLTVGLGFQPDLTGRENVFVSGSLLGLRKREIDARMDEIVEFAEIGEFIEEPVRTYSSGMKARLGFAIATAVRPEILVLDEVFATGDEGFREKAVNRMRDMSAGARCMIIISHSLSQIASLCQRVVWLDRGRLVMIGKPATVLREYRAFSSAPDDYRQAHPERFPELVQGQFDAGRGA